jgi:predicted  nucleic acid-binding Zn-ribbon protein
MTTANSNIATNTADILKVKDSINTHRTEISAIKDVNNTQNTSISTLNGQMTTANSNIATNTADILKVKDSINTHRTEISAIKDVNNTQNTSISTLNGQMSSANSNIATNTADILKVKDSINTHRTEISSIKDVNNTQNTSISTLNGQMSSANSNIATNTADILKVKDSINTHRTEISSIKDVNNTQNTSISTLNGQMTSANSNIATNTADILKVKDSINTHRTEISSIKDVNNTQNTNISTLNGQMSSANSNIATNTADILKHTDSLAVHRTEISSIKDVNNTQNTSISTLNGQMSSANSNIATNTADILKHTDSLAVHRTEISSIKDVNNTQNTSISTLNGQMSAVNSDITSINGQISSLTITTNANSDLLSTLPGIVSPSKAVIVDAFYNAYGFNNISTNGVLQLSSTTPSTLSTNGAFVVAGGAGIGGNLNVAGTIQVGTSALETPGTMKFVDGDFLGFDGTSWQSFINSTSGWSLSGTVLSTSEFVTNLSISQTVDMQGAITNSSTSGSFTPLPVLIDDDLKVNGMLIVGTSAIDPVAGMIKFDGTNFNGYDGSIWKSFTSNSDSTGWAIDGAFIRTIANHGIRLFETSFYGSSVACTTHVNLGSNGITGVDGPDTYYPTVIGGYSNTASGDYSFAAGGYSNSANSSSSAVVGGDNNIVGGDLSFIAGGQSNNIMPFGELANFPTSSAIIAGEFNFISSSNSVIAGGTYNNISGDNSFIAASNNISLGNFSFAFRGGPNEGTAINLNDSSAFYIAESDFVFNPTGTESYFSVNSSTMTNALFVDGVSGHVGIGTNNTGNGASEALNVNGAIVLGTNINNINPISGTIAFTEGGFWGYNGSTWNSFNGDNSIFYKETYVDCPECTSGQVTWMKTETWDSDTVVVYSTIQADGLSEIDGSGLVIDATQWGTEFRGDVIINDYIWGAEVNEGLLVDDDLKVAGAIQLGGLYWYTPLSGMIRWNGYDFDGCYDGETWKPLAAGKIWNINSGDGMSVSSANGVYEFNLDANVNLSDFHAISTNQIYGIQAWDSEGNTQIKLTADRVLVESNLNISDGNAIYTNQIYGTSVALHWAGQPTNQIRLTASVVNVEGDMNATYIYGTPTGGLPGLKLEGGDGSDVWINSPLKLSGTLTPESGTFTVVGAIGTTSDIYAAGNLEVSGYTTITDGCYSGFWGACSDIRYKKDIEPIGSSLEKIMQMKGVYYNWKQDEFPDKNFSDLHQIGFIAQDIEKLFPELVSTDKNGYKSVDYAKVTAVLVEAMKEQQKLIEELQNLTKAQNDQIAQLQSQASDIAQIKSDYSKLQTQLTNLNQVVYNLTKLMSEQQEQPGLKLIKR